MSEEYYIQRIPSGYLGNSPVWWGLNDAGGSYKGEGASGDTGRVFNVEDES